MNTWNVEGKCSGVPRQDDMPAEDWGWGRRTVIKVLAKGGRRELDMGNCRGSKRRLWQWQASSRPNAPKAWHAVFAIAYGRTRALLYSSYPYMCLVPSCFEAVVKCIKQVF
jgi:hypothetical protein